MMWALYDTMNLQDAISINVPLLLFWIFLDIFVSQVYSESCFNTR